MDGGREEQADAGEASRELDFEELLAIATQDLGLSVSDFWKCTLSELEAFMERRARINRQQLAGAAMICAAIANFAPYKRERDYVPADFLPADEDDEETEEKPYRGPPRSDEELLEKTKALFMMFGCSYPADESSA